MTRNRGDGSFRKLADGRWVYQVSLGVDASGVRQRPRFYGATQQQCRDQAEDYRSDLRKGLSPSTGRLLLRDYLRDWITTKAPTLRPSSAERYLSLIEHQLIPHLGHTELANLTRSHVTTMMRRLLAAGLSARTTNYAKVTLGAAVQDAVRDGLVPSNVVRLVRGLPMPRAEIAPLTASEVERLRDAVRGTRDEALYTLALTYGLRQGELLGLTWADVDLAGAVLHVRHSLTPDAKSYALGELKTRQSRRALVMPAFIVDTLLHHRIQQTFEREQAGQGWQTYWPDLVFRGVTGRPVNGPTLTHSFQKLQARLGIPQRRFHDIRHSTATFMLVAGVELKVIQTILGHATIGVTADTYAHVLPALQTDAFERVNAIGTR